MTTELMPSTHTYLSLPKEDLSANSVMQDSKMRGAQNADGAAVMHLSESMSALNINGNGEVKMIGAQDEPSSIKTNIMDFWSRNIPSSSNVRKDKKYFIIDADAPTVTLNQKCKGELMRHQSSSVWIMSELENADSLKFVGDLNLVTTIKTNRYKYKAPMGSGKTKFAIGLVIYSPRPRIRPIYWSQHGDRLFLQERIFSLENVIWPTVIIVRSSTFAQWQDQIAEFSNLRTLVVGDSKTLIQFVSLAKDHLIALNMNYDIILIDYKTISGKTDSITEVCTALFDVNTKKQKHIVPLIMNALSRRCFARIIYDDPEFYIKAAVFENANSCIYLSANHQYGSLRGAAKYYLRDTDPNTFENLLEFPSYTFDHDSFDNMITVDINSEFLTDSINLGISDLAPTAAEVESQSHSTAIIQSMASTHSMMPAEPEVWLCPVVNAESKAIDVIGCLCNDAKIMESVNSLTVTSFAEVIKTLMAGRFEIYKTATRLVSYYSTFDLNSLTHLPKPPEGASFTVENLRRCDPILFAWRDLPNRIADLIKEEKKVIDNERKVLERVKHHLEDAECAICLDNLKEDASGIMLCCNKILHIKCILMCSARRCAFCRTPYGATSKETFAPMHHETDFSAFTDAKSAQVGMEAILREPMTSAMKEELTKLSVLKAIVTGRFAEIKREKVRLKKLGTIIYDPSVEAKCEDRMERLKILIYSSADDTLKKIEADMPIHHAHLTASAAATFAKIKKFRAMIEPSAILANSWRDAAGIDFKTATDVVIMNYVDSEAVVQQMVARLLRMGRVSRARIWLIAFNNECKSWLSTHCEVRSD